jgi:soluble lytic murein transglycosylase
MGDWQTARERVRRGLLALLVLAGAGVAQAGPAIYRYTDDRGVVHFTNVPQDDRYRRVAEDELGHGRIQRVPRHWKFDGLIGLTARQHQLQPALVKAVIAAESNFDPQAVSRKGAQGLMQLMPKTAAALGVEDPLRPIENVNGGSRYLRQMIDRYGDLERALAAYNAGPSAVDRYGGIPPYPETRDYVRKVLTYYRQYHGDFGP